MRRAFFTYAILLIVVLWLVLSFVPSSLLALPQFVPEQGAVSRLSGQLLLVGLIAFLALQAWLIELTARLFQTPSETGSHSRAEAIESFRLTRRAEIFWTAVPLLMTVALAFAGYRAWHTLAIR